MRKSLIFILLILLTYLCGCKTPTSNKTEYGLYRQDFYGYLDTDSFILVEYNKSLMTEEQVKEDVKKIEDILFCIETEYSKEQTTWMKMKNIEKSTTMIINENSGKNPVTVSSEYINLLKQAINVSSNTIKDLHLGNIAKIYTKLIVREDDMSLCGFATKEEMKMFELLTSVSKIGPKVGLSILSFASLN